ncbi:hypothetical protein QZH41_017746, partial [Actinostola sp. cb2023]
MLTSHSTLIAQVSVTPTSTKLLIVTTSSAVLPTTEPAEQVMYPYGAQANDATDDAYYSWKCLKVDIGVKGFVFFGRRHYKLHTCRNGLISFEEPWYRRWPYNFGQYYWFDDQALLAPYWSLIDSTDAFRNGISKMYYHVYKKSDGNPSTASILERARSDVNKHCQQNPLPTEFLEASWVMVVTWVNIRHWYARWRWDLRDMRSLRYLATCGRWEICRGPCVISLRADAGISNYDRYWNARGLPVVGINAGDDRKHYYNYPRSGRVTIADIDNLEGMNIFKSPGEQSFVSSLNGVRGRIFIRLEESMGKENARLNCIDWYYRQPDVFWFHKYWRPSEYESDDKYAYQQCCVHSNMCWMYQERRPSDTCWRYIPPRWSWFWGDPHFVTLDNKNYTFNGVGEFVMLDAKDGHFQLQARTKIAKGEGTATVFSGAVAKETNTSTVQVTLNDNGTLEVCVDGEPFDISGLTNNSKRLNGSVSVSKPDKNCFEMSFPSGMTVKVCEKLLQLSIIAAAPESFKNHTKGLLGTWNGDNEDDFTLPNGTVLPGTSSSKDIHYQFGLAWQVTNRSTLFKYKPGESINSFINASFQPMFVEEITFVNDSLREKAESLCNGDVSCMFDVASTRDLEVGESTKQIGSQLVNDSKKMSNEPPKISNSSAVLYLIVNTTIKVFVNATDPDGDDVTFNVSGLPNDATFSTKPLSIEISWKVTSNKLDIQYIVTDINEAVSSMKPTIYLCACHHGGRCIKPDKTTGSDSSEDRFIVMLCSCGEGYTGKYCESDIDACEANLNPCYPGVECIDLPAPANMTTGYECASCPAGYTGTGASCAGSLDYFCRGLEKGLVLWTLYTRAPGSGDLGNHSPRYRNIDECLQGKSGCSQRCGNTPGSFVCSCNHGYQINIDKKNCDDVNECVPVSDCMHKCTNSPGSYSCSCNENFKVDPKNKKLCVPKNPCKDGEHGCQDMCYVDNDKQQKCACNKGYQLNDDHKTCSDIDECTTNQYRCNQKCHNTKGSYTCSCVSGFELSSDNVTCVDINECMRWTFNCTDSSQICENTPGSYKCTCEEGLYWKDNKCRGRDKGEPTPPPPTAPTPKEPSKNETSNSVNITMSNMKVSEWNKPKEDRFKQVIAEGVTRYCAENEGCTPSSKRASVMESPFSVVGNPFSVMGNPFSVMGNPFSVMGNPFSVMESHFSVMESPFQCHGKPFQCHGKPFQCHGKPFQCHGKPFQCRGKPFQCHGKPFQCHGNPFSVMGNPFSVMESHFSVMESPFQCHGKPFQCYGKPFQCHGKPFQCHGKPFQCHGKPFS